MHLGRFHLSQLPLLSLLAVRGFALKNITVDDTNQAAITYANGGWMGSNEGGFGKGLGSFMYSREWHAYAWFNFTGVAVYYWAPLFGDGTIIDFSLDGGPLTSISLTDPTSPNGAWVPTTPSAVQASFKNLENKPHTLKISIDGGRSTGVVVDYFEVTVDDDAASQTTNGGVSNSPSSASSSPSNSPNSPNLTNNDPARQDVNWEAKYNDLENSFNKIKTALAVVGALFGLFVCCTLLVALGVTKRFLKRGKDDKKETQQSKEKKDEEKLVDTTPAATTKEKDQGPEKGVVDDGPGRDVKILSIANGSDGSDAPLSVLDGSKGSEK